MKKNGEKPKKLSSLESGNREKFWSALDRVQQRLRPVTLAWIINIATVLAILFLIAPPREKKVPPVYHQPHGRDWVIAVRDLELPKDVDVPNFKSMEKEKDDALAATRSVYDWAPAVQTDIKDQVKTFFAGMRELYPELLPQTGETVGGHVSIPSLTPAQITQRESKILEVFSEPLPGGDLEYLKEHHFSAALEQAALDLIDSVYSSKGPNTYLVANKELLLKERGKGILANRLDEPEESPSHKIDDLESVLDIDSARKLIASKAEEKLADSPKRTREILVRLTSSLLEPNLHFNKNKTEAAKAEAVARVKSSYKKYYKGEIITRKGERIEDPYEIRTIDAIMIQLKGKPSMAMVEYAGTFLILLFFFSSLFAFGRVNVRKFKPSAKDTVFMAVTLLSSVAVLKGVEVLAKAVQQNLESMPEGLNFYYLVPLAGSVMLVRMVLNSETALVFLITIAALGGMVVDEGMVFFIYTAIGGLIAAGEVKQCRQRSTIVRAGLVLGLVNVLLVVIASLVNYQFFSQKSLLLNALFGLSGGVIAAIVITGLVPLVESVFGYSTDIKLLELLNQDHPILKELSLRAPGTHQHSLMVGNLAENAAKSIGANPLLARVSAMYHDIGKMNKPPYFAENQWDGANIHDRLTPSMSTLIIHNHTKEGVEMAQKHKLPQMVVEAIRQHHGTALVRFFFEKAKEADPGGSPVQEIDFRYPGPRPQTRETAIIMLADQVESAARSLRDPNPARLQGLVQKLINRSFIDGQLDECDLTLKNLHEIAKSFNTTLGAIYHHRPDYPQAAVKQARPEKRKKDQDATRPKDKEQEQKDKSDKDKEDSENYLKRLGM